MKLIIVTGLSGSGKSIALNTLEDLDYFCIDNLPVGMLKPLIAQIQGDWGKENSLCAVGIDARSAEQELKVLPKLLSECATQGVDSHIIFLHSDENTLLTRFNETRRKHPLSNKHLPLLEALRLEKKLLEPISQHADIWIDTSRTNIYQLRDIIRDRLNTQNSEKMSIQLQSFGFKYGAPIDADLVFDVRCLPNPHWEPELRPLTGEQQKVIDFLEQHDEVDKMKTDIKEFLISWIPHYEKTNRNYLNIALGCTGGQHRSVYLVNALASCLSDSQADIIIRHRELA